MEPVRPLPNPMEMERVIRKAGWLYCGAGVWRPSWAREGVPIGRMHLVNAFLRTVGA